MKRILLPLVLIFFGLLTPGLAQRAYLGGTFAFTLNDSTATFGVQFGANFTPAFGARGVLSFSSGGGLTGFGFGADGLYLVATPNSPINPYIGAGVGLGFLSGFVQGASVSGIVFEGSGVLGVEYLINRQFAIFGEARPGFATGSVTGTAGGSAVSVPISGTTIELRVGANIFF
ncbi:P44/Msp2 family outer membrane protein [Meiothermus sp. CFH 77666]|uniref:P44/Msp2 family outer membrane protein n=1 Tax=Meiothermus sp. CFH 77666 TaxID=2817942 RepID=UPI001AA0269C|nr:P44/Msp2 family outer membrane protein [Meiothermus sp. CFH 77666]MBO1435871.1 P44/Msp2 family outer membrane protein [Meiothermus sp. CFH 77666]